ncbi:MAG: tetratricopeptide repeat protein [Puniceicoccaceae bacterium]
MKKILIISAIFLVLVILLILATSEPTVDSPEVLAQESPPSTPVPDPIPPASPLPDPAPDLSNQAVPEPSPTTPLTENQTMDTPDTPDWMDTELTLNVWDGDRRFNQPELFEAGVKFYNAGKDQEAMETLQRFLDVNPGNPESHLIFSYIFFAQGNYPDAIEEANDVIIEAPGFAAGYLQRARIREALGQYDRALVDMERFLEFADTEAKRIGATNKIAELRQRLEEREAP